MLLILSIIRIFSILFVLILHALVTLSQLYFPHFTDKGMG